MRTAVPVSTSEYERRHDGRQPRGRGEWEFVFPGTDYAVGYIGRPYSEAKRLAQVVAAKDGYSRLVLDPASRSWSE